MDVHVVVASRHLPERPAANVALVGPFARMRAHVLQAVV